MQINNEQWSTSLDRKMVWKFKSELNNPWSAVFLQSHVPNQKEIHRWGLFHKLKIMLYLYFNLLDGWTPCEELLITCHACLHFNLAKLMMAPRVSTYWNGDGHKYMHYTTSRGVWSVFFRSNNFPLIFIWIISSNHLWYQDDADNWKIQDFAANWKIPLSAFNIITF